MAPKVPFEDPVQASNYNVIRGDIKKAKSAITSQLTTLNKEMVNLRKIPTPTLYRKRAHMATFDHSRSEAERALNMLRELNFPQTQLKKKT